MDCYFDDSDEGSSIPDLSEKAPEVPDTIAIVEHRIKAGVLDCPANQLDKIDYNSEHDEP